MNVHVLDADLFFRTSMPIADQQRLLVLPPSKGLNPGDTVFLRNADGELTWVADVLFTGQHEGPDAWGNHNPTYEKYAILGWIARIHPGVLPPGKSKLQANWVLLNKKTIQTTLPWWEDHVLVYHSTMRLAEGILSQRDIKKAAEAGCILQHPSGHWVIPHGEARKRLLIQVLNRPLICGLCGGIIPTLEEATQDHIIPVSQGGPDSLVNVQLAHRECNEAKGNALPEQYPPYFAEPVPGAAITADGRLRRKTRTRRGTTQPTSPHEKRRKHAETVPVPLVAQTLTVPSAGPPPLPLTPSPLNSLGMPDGTMGSPPDRESKGQTQPKEAKGAKEIKEGKDGVVDEAWLSEVQRCGWAALVSRAMEQGWASKTAALRTIQQLRSRQAAKAREEGIPIAEETGPSGHFRLLAWKDQTVLEEELDGKTTYYLVRMLDSITPQVYTWYVSRFGRMAPMAVAMALLNIWNQGSLGADGRIAAPRGNQVITLRIEDDRVVECSLEDNTLVA